jgi:hypothetical protein
MGFIASFFKLLPIRTWASIGAALAVAGFIAWGFVSVRNSGMDACERKHQVELAAHIERAAAQAHQIALQDAEVIAWADTKTRTVFKTLWREHENTAFADCALSPAGRVLWNKATRAATDLTDPSVEAGAAEAADDTGNRDAEGIDSSTSAQHGSDAATGDRPGSGAPDAAKPGTAWWKFWQ